MPTISNFEEPKTRDGNRQYWDERVRNNPLFRSMRYLQQVASDMSRRDLRRAYLVSGHHGIGKTHVFETAFRNAGRPFERITNGTVLGILGELEECACLGKVVLLDDPARQILFDDNFQGALMAATGPSPRMYKYVRARETRIFRLEGLQLVFLTNRDIDAPGQTELFRPLLSRMVRVRIFPERLELFEHACHAVICRDALRGRGGNIHVVNTALRCMAENYHRLEDVSLRSLISIFLAILECPTYWEAEIEQLCKKTVDRQYIGITPKIIPVKASGLPPSDPARVAA